MPFDLVLTGGHVLDPGQGHDGRMDIGVAGGRVVAIGPDLRTDDATQVIDVSGPGRYVVPGLVDIHTHVAHGATTPGVGMDCCEPDHIGVSSGVTTVVDAGSVGVANIGVFPSHILSRANTRVLCYLNIGSHAHTMPTMSDVLRPEDINEAAISSCVTANPGLVAGIKLRLVGPIVLESGEELVRRSKAVAREHDVPLMVHIGDLFGAAETSERMSQVTKFLLESLDAGDILTHLCTPNVGGVMHAADEMRPVLVAARERGVILDSALGAGNFGYQVAREQFTDGLFPDTISSDLTVFGQTFHSLVECMAKFMAVGYSLPDVIAMTTVNAAAAIGASDTLGALALGREADITVLDVVDGDFEFVDTVKETFTGTVGIRPVQTVRAGRLFAPRWGTHAWGWLPAVRGTGTA